MPRLKMLKHPHLLFVFFLVDFSSYHVQAAAPVHPKAKVVICCVENAASVAKTFLTSNVVVVDANEILPRSYWTPMPTSNLMPLSPSNYKPRSVLKSHIQYKNKMHV